MPQFLIYGANGYTGTLTAELAAERGMSPILAGRTPDRIRPLAERLGLPWRAFDLNDRAGLERGLLDVSLVLSAAGPFIKTWKPLVKACLSAGIHYLDITGEIGVFESVLALDEQAKAVRAVLVSGVGFDVVPTDCLAAQLAEKLPDAQRLTLALFGTGAWSPGTLKTMVTGLGQGNWARIDGKIQPVPMVWKQRKIPFPSGPKHTLAFPWGDVSTAFHTTGIPNVTVMMGMPPKQVPMLRAMGALGPVLRAAAVQKVLARAVERFVKGQGADARSRTRGEVWGEVESPSGERVTGALSLGDGYELTADAALRSVAKVLDGAVDPGAWTPARAFGPGFIEECDGVFKHPFTTTF